MTKQEAMDKAQAESKNGYVQHVNRVPSSTRYIVSDWYAGPYTEVSYENGKQL